MAEPPAAVPSPASPGAPRWARGLLTLLAPLALLGLFEWSGLVICPLKNAVGVPCPGCGLTRATEAALRGDWAASWAYHPLAGLLVPLAAGTWLLVSLRAAGLAEPGWLRRLLSPPRWAAWLLVLLTIGLWLGRFAGLMGGPVDPVDLSRGLLTRWLVGP